jgi:DNA-binding transcriptional ArsR family regulator
VPSFDGRSIARNPVCGGAAALASGTVPFRNAQQWRQALSYSIVSKEIEDELRSGPEYSPQLERLMRNARDASDFLKALSHENRLLLLCLLSERERSVGELENILSLRQAAVSQQLARLRLDGLVTTRRDGKTVYYSIANDSVRRVISVMYDIFCEESPPKI